jgi:hypothetical protein
MPRGSGVTFPAPRSRAAAPVLGGPAVPAVLWLAAALISGFTVRRYLDPFDEGLLLQAATRIADGQWPYRDFGWAYGPGQPLVVALAFKAFGPSVIAWRLIRVAADATVAVLVWAFARPAAGPRWAPAAWLAAAAIVAQPTTANPFAVALAFGLGAVLAAARARPALAGLLVAAAAFWRPDFGLLAAAAAIAAAARRHGTMTAKGVTTGARRDGGLTAPGITTGARRHGAIVAAGVAVAAAALLYAPFAIAAGVPRLWDSLVAEALRDGAWWRLPFPLEYGGSLRGWPPRALAEDVKDVLGFYLPAIGVAGVAASGAAIALRRREVTPAAAGLAVFAAGSLVYLLSRPDELHAQPLLVCLCALAPLAAAAGLRGRPLAAILAAVLALVLAAGAAKQVSALLLPPDLERVRVAGATAARVPPAEARALPQMVALVQRLVPPGEPIYVAPRRSDLVTLSNPLVHFLTRRPNVLRRDVLLQARPTEQAAIVAALRRARPRAVVRWTDPLSSRPEPNRRGRPSGSRALDEHLARAYRLRARIGAYDVLVPR